MCGMLFTTLSHVWHVIYNHNVTDVHVLLLLVMCGMLFTTLSHVWHVIYNHNVTDVHVLLLLMESCVIASGQNV